MDYGMKAVALLQTINTTFDELERVIDTIALEADCNEENIDVFISKADVHIKELKNEISLYIKSVPETTQKYRDILNQHYYSRHNQLSGKIANLRN